MQKYILVCFCVSIFKTLFAAHFESFLLFPCTTCLKRLTFQSDLNKHQLLTFAIQTYKRSRAFEVLKVLKVSSCIFVIRFIRPLSLKVIYSKQLLFLFVFHFMKPLNLKVFLQNRTVLIFFRISFYEVT